jgi:hypothetical protein
VRELEVQLIMAATEVTDLEEKLSVYEYGVCYNSIMHSMSCMTIT